MIYLYYGKVGDGKTYHVVNREVIPAILSGRKVYTNIEGLNLRNISTFTSIPYADLAKLVFLFDPYDQSAVKNMYKIAEHGSLIIYDESHDYYDAREYKNADKDFLDFLSKSRHQGFDIVFITQSPKRLEGNIVRLCNFAYQVKNLGFIGRFVKSVYVVHCRQSPYDAIVSTFRGRYDKAVFALYSSFIVSLEKTAKVRVHSGVLGSKALILVAAAIVLILFMVSRGGLGILNADTAKKMVSKDKGGKNAEIPVLHFSDNPNQKGLSVVQVPKGSDTLPLKSSEPSKIGADCEMKGYVEGQGVRYDYFDCGGKMRTYKNGVLFFNAAPLPAYPAPAESGQDAARVSGDLVSNTNNSNTLKKNE